MTSPDSLRRRLDVLEASVGELRRLARPELLGTDLRERRFVEHTLQIAIQAAIDAAAHVVASERFGSPKSAYESFELLARNGCISNELLEVMRQAVGFRNVLVHGYTDVDLRVIVHLLDHQLDDLLGFARSLRARLRR